jgi:transglutaminase-like putative cysteine protease
MTNALAALGVLAVVSTASLSPWTNAALVVGLALALAVPEGWQHRPMLRHVATVAPLGLFIVQGARLVAGRPLLDVAVEFAALLQIVRLATRRGAAHDQQIIVLALLHFVAGTVLGGGLTYALCFFGFLVVAPGALVLSHLRREVEGNYRQGARDRTGLPVDVPRILRSRRVVGRGFLGSTCLLSVPILIFTILLFVLFPRVGLSLLLLHHPRSGRMVGFSDHVDLGEIGALRSDPSIALRFDVPGLPSPVPPRLALRLRGTAFDQYDGRAWTRSPGERRLAEHVPGRSDVYPLLRAPLPGQDRRVSFDLEPIDPPVLFLPPRTVAVEVKPQEQVLLGEPLVLQRGPESELRYAGSDTRGLHYDAYVADDRELFTDTLSPDERTRYLIVPEKLPSRIAELAKSWTAGLTTQEQKARAIEAHLRQDFQYDLGSPSGGQSQPLDHFLFVSKRGHCEFFSTAMAIMLRQVGIPSRNVTGFVGGTYNRFGHYYAVREGEAHSWVEGYVDDASNGASGATQGWVTFDPTPAAGTLPIDQTGVLAYVRDLLEALSQRWNRYVIGYDLRTQTRLLDEAGRRYESLRVHVGADRGTLGKLTRPPVLSGALLLVIGGGAWLLRRRRRARAQNARSAGPTRLETPLENAASLYRKLEAALASHGIVRAPSVTPLRHASELQTNDHPLAPVVVALTDVYLEARFGGAELNEPTKREFERRIQEIRAFRDAPAAPPSGDTPFGATPPVAGSS